MFLILSGIWVIVTCVGRDVLVLLGRGLSPAISPREGVGGVGSTLWNGGSVQFGVCCVLVGSLLLWKMWWVEVYVCMQTKLAVCVD